MRRVRYDDKFTSTEFTISAHAFSTEVDGEIWTDEMSQRDVNLDESTYIWEKIIPATLGILYNNFVSCIVCLLNIKIFSFLFILTPIINY